MNKKQLIALADMIREASKNGFPYSEKQISQLADFCAAQSPAFNRQLWLDYIAGKCGPNGGAR